MAGSGTLRDLLSGGRCAIAASFSGSEDAGVLSDARRSGMDVAEWRIDWLVGAGASLSHPGVESMVGAASRFTGIPTIATIRTALEGGRWEKGEEERRQLFLSVLPEVAGIDVELSAVGIREELISEARKKGRLSILSVHDFDRTPPMGELARRAKEARGLGADLLKVATWAEGLEDIQVLARFALHEADAGVIVLAMGPYGPLSRVFFPALGSRLVYARAGGSAGPDGAVSGQLDLAENVALLRRFLP